MGWLGKRNGPLNIYKVPMCREHHQLVHDLMAPLVTIILELRRPKVTFDVVRKLESVMFKYTNYPGIENIEDGVE